MDASVNEGLSHPINLDGVFTIRTASGDTERASLNGLPSTATYPKSYQLHKIRLAQEQCRDIYDIESETHDERQRKLDNVLAVGTSLRRSIRGVRQDPGTRSNPEASDVAGNLRDALSRPGSVAGDPGEPSTRSVDSLSAGVPDRSIPPRAHIQMG